MQRDAWLPLLLGALTLPALGGCGGSARPAGAGTGATVAWSAMSPEQKSAYMRTTVLPRMKAVFMEFDPHRYPKMDCAPCHAPEAITRGWKMPNPDLLLDPSCLTGTPRSLYGSESAAKAMATMDRFMRERVQPEMAALLGRPPYDPATQKGFDCFGCHTPDRPSVVPLPPVSTP